YVVPVLRIVAEKSVHGGHVGLCELERHGFLPNSMCALPQAKMIAVAPALQSCCRALSRTSGATLKRVAFRKASPRCGHSTPASRRIWPRVPIFGLAGTVLLRCLPRMRVRLLTSGLGETR